MITDKLINKALALAGERKIRDVRAGLGYTCVLLEDGGCGLAYTFREGLGGQCGVRPLAGRLIGMKAAELICWAADKNVLKAAIGLAAANAVFNEPGVDWGTGNIMDAITLAPEDSFAMVGDFAPILERVRQMTGKVYVFERNPARGAPYSDADIPALLPQCSHVLVTATSIINHTFDEVRACCSGAREIFVVGPSTRSVPEVMREYKVTLLARYPSSKSRS
jgi:uncharacterized protein (DUF4213/DUF364 family)